MQFQTEPIFAAFSAAPRPAANEITSHRCCECDRVRDDLAPHNARDVPDDVMLYHADSMPLLTPKAFRYYLPRYVQLTCEKPDSNATDNLLFNLSPDDPESEFWSGRCDSYTAKERTAILLYLEYRRTWPDAWLDEEQIERAIVFWKDTRRK